MSTLSQARRVCAALVLVLALAFPGFFLNGQQRAQPANTVKIGFLMDSLKVEVREGEIWVAFQNFLAGTREKIPA